MSHISSAANSRVGSSNMVPTSLRQLPVQHAVGNGRGFTLIELMIVVVIIGILAAIAYPSYTKHVMKGRRAGAQSYMMQLASVEEQILLDTRNYCATGVPTCNLPSDTTVSSYYTVVVTPTVNPPAYLIAATAIPGSMQASDSPCQTLQLSSDGSKTSKDGGGVPSTGCW